MLADVQALLHEEERRILALQDVLAKPEEHILIHFVQMYLFRYAVPAIEIEGGLRERGTERLRERLWSCLLGRGLDDIVDRDSTFFTAADAAVLFGHYAGLLLSRIASDDRSLWQAIALAGTQSVAVSPTAASIAKDVCRRVDYFLLPTDRDCPDRADLLRRYVGVLLGGCDLRDAVADGVGPQATGLSRTLRRELEDDEGKLLLDRRLSEWHKRVADELASAGESLVRDLEAQDAPYSAWIVSDEVRLFREQAS